MNHLKEFNITHNYDIYDWMKFLRSQTGKAGPKYSGEDLHQFCCITWLDYALPGVMYYGNATASVFNSRDGDERQRLAKIAKIKKTRNLGARKGWPDIQVVKEAEWTLYGYTGLFVELKDPNSRSLPLGKAGQKISSSEKYLEQIEILYRLNQAGSLAVFVYGFRPFQNLIREIYLAHQTGMIGLERIPTGPFAGEKLRTWNDQFQGFNPNA